VGVDFVRRIKRLPGSRPGNHNARKHCYYSQSVLPDEQASLDKLPLTLDHEIALLKLKVNSLFVNDPDNTALFLRAVNLYPPRGDKSTKTMSNNPGTKYRNKLRVALIYQYFIFVPSPPVGEGYGEEIKDNAQ
jgi:hypothetical protein